MFEDDFPFPQVGYGLVPCQGVLWGWAKKSGAHMSYGQNYLFGENAGYSYHPLY